MELRTKARRLQAEPGLDLIIVDYLQLMQSRPVPRRQPRPGGQRDLARPQGPGARAVRCRSSRSRSSRARPEMRPDGEPRLSDLRESGSLEQDSRPRDVPVAREGARRRGRGSEGEVINLRLAKHRNGPTGETKLWFRKRQTRFELYADEERYAESSYA